jgi:hypothetical protein
MDLIEFTIFELNHRNLVNICTQLQQSHHSLGWDAVPEAAKVLPILRLSLPAW